MPTSLETLAQHRAAHAGGSEPQRAWLFHSHAYFDHTMPEPVAEARAFTDQVRRRFAATDHVEVHPFIAFPAGPHPRGSFAVLFTREVFAEYLSCLMLSRPASLDILVHPLTRPQTLDHTRRALWLGTPCALDLASLEAADATALVRGRSKMSIIDGTKKHVLGNSVDQARTAAHSMFPRRRRMAGPGQSRRPTVRRWLGMPADGRRRLLAFGASWHAPSIGSCASRMLSRARERAPV